MMLPSGESLYNVAMRIAFGKIVDGRVELDADLPEVRIGDCARDGRRRNVRGGFGNREDVARSDCAVPSQRTTPMAHFLDELGRNE
jgi:hypothetical protein